MQQKQVTEMMAELLNHVATLADHVSGNCTVTAIASVDAEFLRGYFDVTEEQAEDWIEEYSDEIAEAIHTAVEAAVVELGKAKGLSEFPDEDQPPETQQQSQGPSCMVFFS